MDSKPEQLPDSSANVAHLDYNPQTAIPPAFHEKTAPVSTQRWATRPARPSLLGLLPAAAVIMTTLGFVVAILVILLAYQCVETQGGRGILPAIRKGYFYTLDSEGHKQSDESKSHLWILTISNAAGQVVSGTSAIIMALAAYQVGADWLRLSQSQSSSSSAETPSPAQYGLLVRLLGSSSIRSILEAFVYTVRSWNRARLPRIFRRSLWLATVLWVLARLVGLTDLWLHTTSVSERSNVTFVESPHRHTPLWGVSFNQSICADMVSTYKESSSISPPGFECLGPYEYFISEVAWGHKIAFDAMTNSTNAAFHVGTVERDTAFVLPGPAVVDMGSENFIIPTFATRASCTSLNRVCEKDANTASLNCTAAGYPNFPYIKDGETGSLSAGRVVNRVLGVVGNDLIGQEAGSLESVKIPNNPVKIAVQLQWETLEQGSVSHAQAAEQDLAVDDVRHPTLYAGCDLTFFDAFVRWDSGKQDWNLLNTTESSREQTATLSLPIVWQYATELIAANLMYTARRNSTAETMVALSQDLARLTLATAAGFYKPGDASGVTETESMLVSKYPVLPIAALLLLLCLYALIASVILLSVYRTPDEAIIVPGADRQFLDDEMEPSTLALAQRWLTNPMPLVGYSFAGGDGQDGARSAAYSAINTAYDGEGGHTRLTIGLVGDRFGVTAWGQR
ncbi:hypothetical protein M407DRAFT_29185 [Tulasnella calospora MUT 4182]|uniref:Uncharacterized protein n=1 Tax=Tulasnella calospora MUT 4182 TaxID=1051891 RepID=A0A0C3KI70_9AGAM|nr:hypothetical protein M407DRAFT_29185 [Tulasnella calospora MUT 4182]